LIYTNVVKDGPGKLGRNVPKIGLRRLKCMVLTRGQFKNN